MKIYTKTGDDGSTSLFDGSRVNKDNVRVSTYGDVDELNALIGVIRASLQNQQDISTLLFQIQHDLFALGAQLANPLKKKQKSKSEFTEEKVTFLEKAIDQYEKEYPAIKSFILPGGSLVSGYFDLARTVCRRAERSMVSLTQKNKIDAVLLIYINRLSDLFFVLARMMNARLKCDDVPWEGK